MLLKELLEAQPKKTAVIAWGRMNPPTIGHQKVVDTVKSTSQKVLGLQRFWVQTGRESPRYLNSLRGSFPRSKVKSCSMDCPYMGRREN